MAKDYPIKRFSSAHTFKSWLAKNHAQASGLWICFFKKDSGKKTIVYREALDIALCYGWIDGQTKSVDSECYLQKFTPRRPRSVWSKRNTEHVERLVREKRMRAPGLAQVAAAKKDGRWAAAYDSPRNASPPKDFLDRVSQHPIAHDYFLTLSKSLVYRIVFQLQTAKKPETRARRIEKIFESLKSRRAPK